MALRFIRQRKFRFRRDAKHIRSFAYLYGRLAGEDDRQLLKDVADVRLLGSRFERFREFEKKYIENMRKIDAEFSATGQCLVNMRDYGLTESDVWIEISHHPDLVSYVLTCFICGQYQHPWVALGADDCCLDIGAYKGETSLLLADRLASGERGGRVYAVEFGVDQVNALRRNLQRNAELAKRIHLIANPLWSQSDMTVYMTGSDIGTKIGFENPGGEDCRQFQTLTLDDMVEKHAIPKVSMIKMDVEGAEYPILLGARETLRRHKPLLALSIYHSHEDFSRIPQFLDTLDCGYEFSLGHYTSTRPETILYARSAATPTAL